MLVVIFHRFLYDWQGIEGFFFSEEPWNDYPWLTLFMIFVAMGSIFTLITGIVTAFSIYNRVSSGRSTMKPIILGSIIMMVFLLFWAFVVRFFFAPRAFIRGKYYYGVLSGSILFKSLHIPSLGLMILITGTLGIIGISGFILTVILVILFRNGGSEKIGRNKIVLGVIGVLILILSVILSFILQPIIYDAFDNGNYLLALILALLVADSFPIFPILGFAFFGAILGIQLAKGEDEKKIIKSWTKFALLILITGFVLLMVFGSQGYFNMNFIRFIQLGFYFFIIIILLKVVDFKPEEKQEKILSRTKSIFRFSRVSLTIYVFESAIAVIFHFFLDYMIPGWNNDILNILLFGVFNLVLWWIILIFWEKKDFKGSIEWMGAQLMQKLSGKSKDKSNKSF